MSDKEENDDKEIPRRNRDGGFKIPETLTEGNLVSLNSNKNTENSSTKTENMPRSAAIEGFGDTAGGIVQENSKLDKIETELTEMSKDIINTDAGKGSGDYSMKANVTVMDDKITEDINTEINVKASKTDVISVNDASNDDLLDKCDDIELEKAEDLDEDEDMQLRWDDDDDTISQSLDNDKNDGIMTEEQLLEDSSDVLTEKGNLESVTHEKCLEDKLLEKPDDNAEAIKSPEMVLSSEEGEDFEMNSETGFIAQTKEIIDMKSKDEQDTKSAEKQTRKESVDNIIRLHKIYELAKSDHEARKKLPSSSKDVLSKDNLLEDSEMNSKPEFIALAKQIVDFFKSIDEPVKETQSSEKLMTEKELLYLLKQATLLTKSESDTETLKILSATKEGLSKEICLDSDSSSDSEGKFSVGKLSEMWHSDAFRQHMIDLHRAGVLSINPEKEFPMNKELEDVVLLEEKHLEESETAEVIPESDVTMEVDEENEEELLKDHEGQNDSFSPMDVDITDPSIEHQAKIEDKIVDQPMDDESEVGKIEAVQTNLEQADVDRTADEIKVMDESDAQLQITEKIIDQLVEETSKTVEVIKDILVVEKTETVESNKEIALEDEAKKDGKNTNLAASEMENVNQPMDDEKQMDEKSKDQLSATNTTKESIKTPEQSDALTVSNIEIEGHEKSIPDKSTLEEVIESKKEHVQAELNTENVHKDINFENLENSKEISALDRSLSKHNVTAEISEISASSSSILRDSLSSIKGFHGVNKADVMLEIPTQELIDMDLSDLSMNLDQSEVLDGDENMEKYSEDDKTIDKSIAEDDTVTEKSVDDIAKVVDATANQNTINQNKVTETNADKISTEHDAANKKSVDQQTTLLLLQLLETTVKEVPTGSKIVEGGKKDEAVVEATIEENMEKMFADDEPEVTKEVPESIASTSQTLEQPSTSTTQMTPDTSDEVPDVSDSLGLLAESTRRVMEDDEENEDDDDGDDDDDFDQDESSTQVSAEQSEDSNPAAVELEPEPVAEKEDKELETEDKELETPDPKESEFPFLRESYAQDKGQKVHMGFGTMDLQSETTNEINEEATSAVAALLNSDDSEIKQAEAPEKTPEEAPEEMDIETVKLSDTSDNDADVELTMAEKTESESSKEVEEKQKQSPAKSPSKSPVQSKGTSPKGSPSKQIQSASKQSPSKMKNLAVATQAARSVVNIVDLEESSSSDDDVQETEVKKQLQPEPETKDGKPVAPDPDSKVTSVNIPTGIDIMCTSGGITSEITTKDGEAVISGVPKPPRHKPARLNTSEVSIKTVSSSEPMVIPETTINEQTSTQQKPNLGLEIFSLDSDEEDSSTKATEQEKPREKSKCINFNCTSDSTVPYMVADTAEKTYYGASKKRRAQVCQPCSTVVTDRTKSLIQGMKNLTPLLDLDMRKSSQDLVEISDSDSDEDMSSEEPKEVLGKKGAKILEDSLSQFLNDTWKKYKMDARLKETQIMLDDEIEKLEQDSKEIDAMLNACQMATDKLRCDLYATFECRLQQLPPIVIQDTPELKYFGHEEQFTPPVIESAVTRHAKRRLSSTTIDVPAKRPAIPLGYAPLDSADAREKAAIPAPESKPDDDKDISVVKLSAEAAPADLPPPGEISRPPLRVGMPVYAMKNAFGPWLKGKVLEMQPKNPGLGQTFSLCRVRFDHKAKSNGKVLPARSIAYSEPADVRMTIGTRLIALFKDSNKRESYYSGVVAEIPNPVNNYRYLVFFDDGYAQYVQHQYTRLVCESSSLVWEEVHPLSREFVRAYLLAYPERPMVRLHTGQNLKTEWNGKWWASRVTRVDASLAQVMFVEDGRREWIYRGSTRLAPLYLELRAAERHRPRPMPRSKAQPRLNMPYVEYTRSDEPESSKPAEAQVQVQQQIQQQQLQRDEEIRRQRAVAKKSTSAPQPYPPSHQVMPPLNTDPVTSRVVYYTPKNAVRPLKMVPHRCTPKCKRSDVLSLKELRTYNPLAKPLLSGWERQIVRFKGHKDVMYRAPCGRRIRNMRELHHYLRSIDSDLPVDLFDFHYSTHCLAEFVLNKCLVGKKDLSHGKENVPVPCVNYYDDSLPEFCSYNTERTPTAGVPLNLEPEFLCGCDCTDDCQDKSKCACWKMTLEGARTIGLRGPNVGYVYKRLPEPLPSGIYECNSRCKCKHTCLNRVAQHPLQLKLQVFKTPNRGWGIRALNDVPKGSFLCVYAGNLLTDATANLDGLNEGDEYLAELDYIEVVEQMKEGYEEDIPEADKKLDKKEQGKDGEESDEEPSSTSEDEGNGSKTDKEDDDFRPGSIAVGGGADVAEFNKRLRRREKSKKGKGNAAAGDDKEKEKDTSKDNKETKEGNGEDDCITISDDEEVREPSRFMAQTNMGANEYISKYKSVRTLFGKDEACYIMDAKVQGNIGRYLNHSCQPNVFVQNVFVDTHDPRFPWVAFFALSLIKAGTELTWNYNYDVGSVPGKVLYCYCGAVNCRGRLL